MELCTKMEQIVNISPVLLTRNCGDFILEKEGKLYEKGGIYVFGFVGM